MFSKYYNRGNKWLSFWFHWGILKEHECKFLLQQAGIPVQLATPAMDMKNHVDFFIADPELYNEYLRTGDVERKTWYGVDVKARGFKHEHNISISLSDSYWSNAQEHTYKSFLESPDTDFVALETPNTYMFIRRDVLKAVVDRKITERRNSQIYSLGARYTTTKVGATYIVINPKSQSGDAYCLIDPRDVRDICEFEIEKDPTVTYDITVNGKSSQNERSMGIQTQWESSRRNVKYNGTRKI